MDFDYFTSPGDDLFRRVFLLRKARVVNFSINDLINSGKCDVLESIRIDRARINMYDRRCLRRRAI